jgi:hypothetical protein
VPSYVLGFKALVHGRGREPQKSGRKFTTKYLGVEQRFYKFIVVCFLVMLMSPVAAQYLVIDSLPRLLQERVLFSSTKNNGSIIQQVTGSDNVLFFNKSIVFSPSIPIRKDHYILNFGFFCRKELQFETRTSLPLRFRLGSLAHCNYLEGKQ